jgi:citrate lyase subunit beta/citryl-CoA lyase
MAILRSLLFAPATHSRHVQKALTGTADAAIIDLEDAVAVAEKPAARQHVRAAIETHRTPLGPKAYVRINGLTTAFAYDDLRAVVGPGLDGIVLPKTESAAQVATADWLLAQLERAAGLETGAIDLMPIIETAAGLVRLRDIASATRRVRRLNFGAGDFSLDTNMTWVASHEGLLWARVQVVVESRAAGLEPPIDTVYAHLDDVEGLAHEAAQAQTLGYQGKACIHPRQVEIVNAAFTPSASDVARATAIVDAFEQAEQSGVAAIQVDGTFVDYPVAVRARRTLEIASHLARTAPRD